MRKRLNIKGETLAETIIALSILAVGITVASTVVLNSIRNMTNSKNRVVAVNIAREGIEAIRGIRDTNWLFYSDRRRQCWNHDPSAAGPCDGSTPIPPDTYIVYKHTDGSWRLMLADDNLAADGPDGDGDTTNDLDRAALSLVDRSDAIDSNGDGDSENDTDFYNHKHASVVVDSLGTLVKSTIYTRYVTIEYLENQPVLPTDSIKKTQWDLMDPVAERPLLNRMRITSVVGWQIGGNPHSVELETILTDHLGREDLAS